MSTQNSNPRFDMWHKEVDYGKRKDKITIVGLKLVTTAKQEFVKVAVKMQR